MIWTAPQMLEQQQQQRSRRRTAASGPGPGAGLRAGGSLKSFGGTAGGGAPLRPYMAPLGGRPLPSPGNRPGAEAGPAQCPGSTPLGVAGRPGLATPQYAGADGCGNGYYDGTAADGSPGKMQQRQQQLQLLRRRSSGNFAGRSSAAAAAAIYGSAAAPAVAAGATTVVGSPARALRSGGRGAGGGQQRDMPYSPQAKPSRVSSPSPVRPRPGSAPDELAGDRWSAAGAPGVEPAAAASAAAAEAAASAVNAPTAASGGSPAADGPQRTSGFRNLLRLQQLLLQVRSRLGEWASVG